MYGSAGLSRFFVAAGLVVRLLRRAEQREVGPQQHDLRAAALGRDAEVEPRVALAPAACVSAKNESRRSGPGGGKTSTVAAAEQRPDLVLGPAHRGGRGDDLRAAPLAVHLARAQRVEGRLVQPDHRAERAGDQVQLVLDDQVGRRQRRRAAAGPTPGSHGP